MAKEENKKDVFVAIPATLGGIFLVIVVLFLLFANASLGLLIPIVWAFVVLGGLSAFFAERTYKKK